MIRSFSVIPGGDEKDSPPVSKEIGTNTLRYRPVTNAGRRRTD